MKKAPGITTLPEVVVGLQAAGSAERPARAAVLLVLHGGHGPEVSPVARGGRSAAGAEAEGAVLALEVGRRTVLARAQGAAHPEVCRLELLPVESCMTQR